jgi:outer membrane protein OmpA-like peptidoglycan-associated protein
MKRLLLIAALLAAPLAYAQNEDQMLADEAVVQLQSDLERLRADDNVVQYAGKALTQAEAYIEDLATAGQVVQPDEIAEAERLLQRVEQVATRRTPRVVVVEDEAAKEAARNAREESELANAAADVERERALAARLETEQERAENARLREELGMAQTRLTERGVVLTLGDVLFEVGKSDLKAGATRSLDKLVAAMRKDPELTVTIEGHTDSTGKRDFNVELSQRRANAVRSYLAAKGISSPRLEAAGLGPDYPVASNTTAEGRQQNRRVELLVQNDGD